MMETQHRSMIAFSSSSGKSIYIYFLDQHQNSMRLKLRSDRIKKLACYEFSHKYNFCKKLSFQIKELMNW